MRELVISVQRKLKRNAKGFDRHYGYRTDSRTDRKVVQRIRLSILWSDLVDHDHREYGHKHTVYKKACRNTSACSPLLPGYPCFALPGCTA